MCLDYLWNFKFERKQEGLQPISAINLPWNRVILFYQKDWNHQTLSPAKRMRLANNEDCEQQYGFQWTNMEMLLTKCACFFSSKALSHIVTITYFYFVDHHFLKYMIIIIH